MPLNVCYRLSSETQKKLELALSFVAQDRRWMHRQHALPNKHAVKYDHRSSLQGGVFSKLAPHGAMIAAISR